MGRANSQSNRSDFLGGENNKFGADPSNFCCSLSRFRGKLLGWSLHKKDYCPALGLPRSSGQVPEVDLIR